MSAVDLGPIGASASSGTVTTLTLPYDVPAGGTILVGVVGDVSAGGLGNPWTVTDDAGNWYAADIFHISSFYGVLFSAQNVLPLQTGQHIHIAQSVGVARGSAVIARAFTGMHPSSLGFSVGLHSTTNTISQSGTRASVGGVVFAMIGVVDSAAGATSIAFSGTATQSAQSNYTGLSGTQRLAVFESRNVSSTSGSFTASGTVTDNLGTTSFAIIEILAVYDADRRLAAPILPNITDGILSSPNRWLIEVVASTLTSGVRQSAEIDLCHMTAQVKWRGQGVGQLDIPTVAKGYDLCVEGNYVILTDLLSGWQWQSLITDVQRNEAAEKNESKACTLADLRFAIYSRIIAPGPSASSGTFESGATYSGGVYQGPNGYVSISGATEMLAKLLVTQNCLNRHTLSGLHISGNTQKGVVQYINVTGEPLSKFLPQLLAVDDFGDIGRLIDNGATLDYDVMQGRDRSAGTKYQQIFSVNLDNVTEINYLTGRSGHVNAVLVLGKAAGTVDTTVAGQQPVLYAGRPTMWVEDSAMIAAHGRIEAVVDAGDAATSNSLTTAGLFYLALHQEVKKLTFIPRESALSRFGTGWQVGDLVSVESTDWNVIQNVRIQQVDIDVGNPDLKMDAQAETMNFMTYATDVIGLGAGAPSGDPYQNLIAMQHGQLPAAVTPALAQQFGPGAPQSMQQFHMSITVGNDRPDGAHSWRALPNTATRSP